MRVWYSDPFEVPLPEAIVQATVDETVHNAIHGLDHDEAKFEEQLKEQGSSREEFDADTRTNAEKAVKTQLLMDAIADELDVKVGQGDLMERIALMARQYGIEPQQLIQILQQNNQLPSMFADIRRGMTIAAVVHGATVTDTDGNAVDTAEFFGPAGGAEAEAAEETEAEAEAPAADEAPAEEAKDEKPAKAKKAGAEGETTAEGEDAEKEEEEEERDRDFIYSSLFSKASMSLLDK